MKAAALTGFSGLLLGYSLSRIGFSSWDEVHGMFTFGSLRLVFAFALAVIILMIAWKIIHQVTGATWSPRLVHKGTIIGGVLFGLGWAISGACPSIALVQLGEGQLGDLVTLAGMLGGNYLYSVIHERYFRWSTRSCAED